LADVGIVRGEPRDGFVRQAQAVISLLVLAPDNVTDERRVVINNPLAAELRDCVKTFVTDECLVDLVRSRIADGRISRIKGIGEFPAPAVVIPDRDLGELAFREQAESIELLGLKSDAFADGQGVGCIESVDIPEFMANADVNQGLQPGLGLGCSL
jgi:hypothetical protein